MQIAALGGGGSPGRDLIRPAPYNVALMSTNPALDKIVDEPRIGYVAEHGSLRRPIEKRDAK